MNPLALFLILASRGVVGQSAWHDAGDQNPFTFSLSPDGRPCPLRLEDGRRVRPADVEKLYGQPGGFRILDQGVDVGSQAWSDARDFTRARRVLYQDLSNRAGWPNIHVPSGIIALDPSTGRLKFCEGNPNQPLELVKKVPLPHGEPMGVALKGHYAFLVSDYSARGLQVLDVRDPCRPVPVADLNLTGNQPPQLQGDILALTDGWSSKLLDVSVPDCPRILSGIDRRTLSVSGVKAPYDVVTARLCGRVLYVGYGLQESGPARYADGAEVWAWAVFDISSPSQPRLLGDKLDRFLVPDAFHAGRALTWSGNSLDVLDLSEPTRPKVVKALGLPGPLHHLTASGDTAYGLVADRQFAVFFLGSLVQRLVTVSPTVLELPEHIPFQRQGETFCADRKRLFVAGEDPAKKRQVLVLYELTEGGRLQRLATLSASPFYPCQLAVEGDRLVIVDKASGFWLLSIKEALRKAARTADREVRLVPVQERDAPPGANDLIVGLWPTGAEPYGEGTYPVVQTSGDTVIVGSEYPSPSLPFLDVRDPEAPVTRRIWRQRGITFPVLEYCEFFCARFPQDGTWAVVDFSNPFRPKRVGNLGAGREGVLAKVGDLAYLFSHSERDARNAGSVVIYDLHDPATPFFVQEISLPKEFAHPYCRFLVKGQRLYAATNGGKDVLAPFWRHAGIAIFDVSDPLRPVPLGQRRAPEISYWTGIELGFRNGLLYVTASQGDGPPGLLVYDAGEPGKVEKAGAIPLSELPAWVYGSFHYSWKFPAGPLVEGDFLYVTDMPGDLRVYDLRADPTAPTLVDSTPGSAGIPACILPAPSPYDSIQSPGVLHRDHLICPSVSGLSIYRTRTCAERPAGPLTLQSVPDSERFRKVVGHVRSSMVALDEASAAAILVRQKGKTVFEWYFGKHNWSPDARPVDADSRFPIWSLTKAYVATALGLALDAGKVKLDDPVCLYVPEYTGKGKEKVTLRHLATHTAGLTGLGEWREAELVKQPGEVPQYSNIGMDLLAHAVGKAMGDGGFGQTLQKRLFEPLGLSHSGFLCPGDDTTLLVPAVKTRKDEPWYDPWGPEGRGMAGLYVSARDLAAFGELYLNGGELNGKRILAASTVRLLTSPRQAPGSLADKVPYQALAWRIQGNWPLSEQDVSAPAGTISHTGGTHCYIMVCPALELVAVKLLNRGYWPGTFDFDGDFRRFCKLVVEAAVGEP